MSSGLKRNILVEDNPNDIEDLRRRSRHWACSGRYSTNHLRAHYL